MLRRSLATHAPQVLSSLANQIMVVLLGCMQVGAPELVASKAATVAEELLVKHEYVFKSFSLEVPYDGKTVMGNWHRLIHRCLLACAMYNAKHQSNLQSVPQ